MVLLLCTVPPLLPPHRPASTHSLPHPLAHIGCPTQSHVFRYNSSSAGASNLPAAFHSPVAIPAAPVSALHRGGAPGAPLSSKGAAALLPHMSPRRRLPPGGMDHMAGMLGNNPASPRARAGRGGGSERNVQQLQPLAAHHRHAQAHKRLDPSQMPAAGGRIVRKSDLVVSPRGHAARQVIEAGGGAAGAGGAGAGAGAADSQGWGNVAGKIGQGQGQGRGQGHGHGRGVGDGQRTAGAQAGRHAPRHSGVGGRDNMGALLMGGTLPGPTPPTKQRPPSRGIMSPRERHAVRGKLVKPVDSMAHMLVHSADHGWQDPQSARRPLPQRTNPATQQQQQQHHQQPQQVPHMQRQRSPRAARVRARAREDHMGALLQGGTLPAHRDRAKASPAGAAVHPARPAAQSSSSSPLVGPPSRFSAAHRSVDSMGALLQGGTLPRGNGVGAGQHVRSASEPRPPTQAAAAAAASAGAVRRGRAQEDHMGALLQGGTLPGHQRSVPPRGARPGGAVSAPGPGAGGGGGGGGDVGGWHDVPLVRSSAGAGGSARDDGGGGFDFDTAPPPAMDAQMTQLMRGPELRTAMARAVDPPDSPSGPRGERLPLPPTSPLLNPVDSAPTVTANLDPRSVMGGWYNGGHEGEHLASELKAKQEAVEAARVAKLLADDKLVPVAGLAPAAQAINMNQHAAARKKTREELILKLEQLTGSASGNTRCVCRSACFVLRAPVGECGWCGFVVDV